MAIQTVTSSDDAVLEPLRVSELSEPLNNVELQWLVAGRSPGTATVEIDGLFNDDTVRTVSAEYEVLKADKVVAGVHCPGDPDGNTRLFPPGQEVTLQVGLSAGERSLDGMIVEVLQGPNLVQKVTTSGPMVYTWVAPEEPGSVTIRSKQFPEFALELTTYDPKDARVQRIKLPGLLQMLRNQRHGIGVDLVVDGRTPCFPTNVKARTLTPDVCTGPTGAKEWVADSPGVFGFVAVAGGTCRLSVAVNGTDIWKEVEFAYEVVDR